DMTCPLLCGGGLDCGIVLWPWWTGCEQGSGVLGSPGDALGDRRHDQVVSGWHVLVAGLDRGDDQPGPIRLADPDSREGLPNEVGAVLLVIGQRLVRPATRDQHPPTRQAEGVAAVRLA